MIPLLFGITLVVVSLIGLWRVDVRDRKAAESRSLSKPRGPLQALGRYFAVGAVWVVLLVMFVIGVAISLWAYASL